MGIKGILEIVPFSFDKGYKHQLLNERLHELTHKHYAQCEAYHGTINACGLDINNLPDYEQLPFLPVRLFKEFEPHSCEESDIVKTMTPSGTTGQQVSRTFLDRETSSVQQKCLTKIVGHFFETKRVLMLILDSSTVAKSRNMFSARGAGIFGFSTFGNKRQYALDESMKLGIEGMKKFLENNKDETIFMFGFMSMIWQHFYKKLLESGYKPDLSKDVLIHGGGWKKLVTEKVTSEEYRKNLNEVCGTLPDNVHDYYGMAEQIGCIYMECECGHLHASAFSDVLIRRPFNFSLAETGEKGLIEVVSVLPESYLSHVSLTEDGGRILGGDDCPCGLKGKHFKIEGRTKSMELRGCSDTYTIKF